MDIFEELLSLTNDLPDDKKEPLRLKMKELNQQKGKALSDLNDFKSKLEVAKVKVDEADKIKSSYNQLMGEFEKRGMAVKDAEELLKKLEIEKTKDDELAILKKKVDEQDKQIKEYHTKKEYEERKAFLDSKLGKAMTEFKDKDGNPYKLIDRFIDKESLYKPIDTSVEALVNDRITQALQNGYNEQEKFQQETGMKPVTPVHNVDPAVGGFSGGITTNVNSILSKLSTSSRDINSAAMALAEIKAARQTEK